MTSHFAANTRTDKRRLRFYDGHDAKLHRGPTMRELAFRRHRRELRARLRREVAA